MRRCTKEERERNEREEQERELAQDQSPSEALDASEFQLCLREQEQARQQQQLVG